MAVTPGAAKRGIGSALQIGKKQDLIPGGQVP
jgi:hypothetical protein